MNNIGFPVERKLIRPNFRFGVDAFQDPLLCSSTVKITEGITMKLICLAYGKINMFKNTFFLFKKAIKNLKSVDKGVNCYKRT